MRTLSLNTPAACSVYAMKPPGPLRLFKPQAIRGAASAGSLYGSDSTVAGGRLPKAALIQSYFSWLLWTDGAAAGAILEADGRALSRCSYNGECQGFAV